MVASRYGDGEGVELPERRAHASTQANLRVLCSPRSASVPPSPSPIPGPPSNGSEPRHAREHMPRGNIPSPPPNP